jgi:GTPase SAR1 family protein
MKKQKINPIIRPVMESFQTAYYQTKNFAENRGSMAMNGLLVMGDAGTGKSHWVKQALRDAGVQKDVEMLKGGTITAASLYVKLYLNRHAGRIIVLDDVDIIGHPEKNKIVPLILGVVQEGKNRECCWNTAKRNALMEEYDVPMKFVFNGTVIVITNYTTENIAEKLTQWKGAFKSRFINVECVFNHEQKYLYTKHLVENEAMLGANCRVHEYKIGKEKLQGYPEEVVEETMDFIDDNYMNFSDITPRVAISIADVIFYNKDKSQKRIMLNNLVK